MNTNRSLLFTVTATTAFTGGLISGLLFAPKSGQRLRRTLAVRTRVEARRAGARLHAAKKSTGQQIGATGGALASSVRETTGKAVGHYVPALTLEGWHLDSAELAEELGRLPRC